MATIDNPAHDNPAEPIESAIEPESMPVLESPDDTEELTGLSIDAELELTDELVDELADEFADDDDATTMTMRC